jgi:WD40 repeat protein
MPLSFFVTGGTLRRGSASYIERRADQELFEALSGGEYCYVLTSRQMGKSSLMVRTAHRLREGGVRTVVLDLTALGQSVTPEQWYGSMLGLLGEQLRRQRELMSFWRENAHEGPLRRWMGALAQALDGEPLVVFIDEIDAVRSLPFPTDEFFAAIRECYNRRSTDPHYEGLTFCLLGVATPSDLIRDTRTTPFNIGRRIELTDFTAEEALPLASGLAHHGDTETRRREEGEIERGRDRAVREAGDTPTTNIQHPTPNAQRLLRRILYWTEGHPYLTQRLCAAVADRLKPEGAKRTWIGGLIPHASSLIPHGWIVDSVCREVFLGARAEERDDNLRFVRDRLLRGDGDTAGLLDAYARVRASGHTPAGEANPLLDELRLAGVVRDATRSGRGGARGLLGLLHRGRMVVRNRVYARVFDGGWIRTHMPDAEMERQKRAYRRGVARASALAGVVMLTLLGLTVVAVERAEAARRAQVNADGLVGSLSVSLRAQRTLNQRLGRALEAARSARRNADESAAAATEARRDEARQKRQALRAGAQAEVQRALAERRRAVAEAARAAAVHARAVAQRRLSVSHVSAGMLQAEQGDPMGALAPLAEAMRLDAHQPDRQRMDRLRLASVLAGLPRLAHAWFDPWESVWCELSPNGEQFLIVGAAGRIRIVDAATGRLAREIRCQAPVEHAAFSPDARRVAVAGGDGTARVWDATTGRPVTPPLGHPGPVHFVEWSRDGARLAAASDDGATVWDAATGGQVSRIELKGASTTRVRFTPNGRLLVVTSGNFLAWAVEAESGTALVSLGPCYNTQEAVVSPDGAQVLIAGSYGTGPNAFGGFLCDLSTGRVVRELRGRGMGRAAGFSPDGRWLVIGDDYQARVWDTATGAPVTPVLPHPSGVSRVEFSRDGRRVLTAGRDGTVRIWDAATGEALTAPLRHAGRVLSAAFGGDAQRVLATSAEGSVRLWELQTPESTARALVLPDLLAEPPRLLLAGRRLLTRTDPEGPAGAGAAVQVWDTQSRRLLFPPPGEGPYPSYRLSGDGRRVLLLGAGTARMWAAESGTPLSPPISVEPGPRALYLQRDGRRFVEVTPSGGVVVRDAATGALVASTSGRGSLLDPEGRFAGAPGPGGTFRLWDLQDPARAARRLPWSLHLDSAVRVLRVSPDGRAFFTITQGGVLRAWELRTGRPLSPPVPNCSHPESDSQAGIRFSADGARALVIASRPTAGGFRRDSLLFSLRGGGSPRLLESGSLAAAAQTDPFSADGRYVFTASDPGTLRIWDALTGRVGTPPLRHRERVAEAAFTPDGRRLMTVRVDGVVQLWDARTGRRASAPMAHGGPVTKAVMSPDGLVLATSDAGQATRLWDARTGEPLCPPVKVAAYAAFSPAGGALVVGGGRQVRFQPLTREGRPASELLQFCALLSGQTADDLGGRVELEPSALKEAWAALRRARGAARK